MKRQRLHTPRIILASASARRTRILRECGIPHQVALSNAVEAVFDGRHPVYTVRHNARLKALAVAQQYRSALIIGADTIVVFNQRIIGKPVTLAEAARMLRSFSGKTISVYTGMCLYDTIRQRAISGTAHSRVHVRTLSRNMIARILVSLDPLDRAGGFSIEGLGACAFDMIEGSFYNILGLPMTTLYTLCKRCGIDLAEFGPPLLQGQRHA